jgi:hypothetical protein
MGNESKRTRNETWPFALKQEGHTFIQGGHRSFATSATRYAPGHAKATFGYQDGTFTGARRGVLAADSRSRSGYAFS